MLTAQSTIRCHPITSPTNHHAMYATDIQIFCVGDQLMLVVDGALLV